MIMKLIKQASGKTTVKMSKKEWTDMGKKAGWLNKEAYGPDMGGDNPYVDYYAQKSNQQEKPKEIAHKCLTCGHLNDVQAVECLACYEELNANNIQKVEK
jgi:hypothetical protein